MKFEKPFVLGIDAGTGSIRVGIFDAKGRPVSFSNEEYATQDPEPGWAEQDPDEWWSALVSATHQTLRQCNVTADEIVLMGRAGA